MSVVGVVWVLWLNIWGVLVSGFCGLLYGFLIVVCLCCVFNLGCCLVWFCLRLVVVWMLCLLFRCCDLCLGWFGL